MNLILSFYFWLPNLQHRTVLGKAFNRGLAKLIRIILDIWAPLYFRLNSQQRITDTSSGKNRPWKVVASLTSFPARIQQAYLSIECILRQSIKPDLVILWLSKDQFPKGVESLPKELKRQMQRGLDIRFCDEDLMSHKKYHYAIQLYPNDKVILFDDDLYYHRDTIKNLLHLHRLYPNSIAATRTHRMAFDSNGLRPYSKWEHNYNEEIPSLFLMHTSGSGTLIPGRSIFDDVFFDKKLLMDLSPKSDDVWFKFNLIRLGITVVTNNKFNKDPITIGSTHTTSLVSTNSFGGEKDRQILRCVEYFRPDFTKKASNFEY
jgi:hypothetical protein